MIRDSLISARGHKSSFLFLGMFLEEWPEWPRVNELNTSPAGGYMGYFSTKSLG